MTPKYLSFNDALYEYMIARRSGAEDGLLAALRAETDALGEISRMAIGPEQADFLQLLVAVTGTERAVEVGTFTGSSAISIARGLGDGGKLVCFDQSEEWTAIARRYWRQAGLDAKIELRLGDARQSVARYQPDGPIDFAFIDADKEGYDFYYEALLPHMRTGGLMVFDNMLRGGAVADPARMNDPEVQAIDALNRKLAADARVQSVLIPVADGLHLCRKRKG